LDLSELSNQISGYRRFLEKSGLPPGNSQIRYQALLPDVSTSDKQLARITFWW